MRRRWLDMALGAAWALLCPAPARTPEAPRAPRIDYRPAVAARLVKAIARHEHCVKWHNPGCLAFAGQPGAARLKSGYARFARAADGEAALARDVRAKLARGMTVRQIALAWNGGGWLEAVLRETGLPADVGW